MPGIEFRVVGNDITPILEKLSARVVPDFEAALAYYAEVATIYVQAAILAIIAEGHPIGHFMAPRTKVEAVWGGKSMVLIKVTGRTEGEMEGSAVAAKHPIQPEMSLWHVFEDGTVLTETRFPTNSLYMVWKDTLTSKLVMVKSAGPPKGNPSELTMYKGQIASLVEMARVKILEILYNAGEEVAGWFFDELARTTGIKFESNKEERQWIVANDINVLLLQQLGVKRVDTKTIASGGGITSKQILARDAGGRFMSLGMDGKQKFVVVD